MKVGKLKRALEDKITGKGTFPVFVKLNITGTQLIRNNLSLCNSPAVLVDGVNTTAYFSGFAGQNYYPLYTVIDLNGNCTIDKISFLDVTAGAVWKVRSGTTIFNMTEDGSVTMTGGGARSINLAHKSVNFIELEITTNNGKGPAQITVYGSQVTSNPVPSITVPAAKTYTNFVGVNCNSYLPAYWPILYRQYEYFEKTYPNQTQLRVNPTLQGNTFFDTEYQVRKTAGVVVSPVTFHAPQWQKASYTGAGQNWALDTRPCLYTSDPYLPVSWNEPAKLGYQYGLRWGRTVQPLANSTVNTTDPIFGVYNTKKTALNELSYIEMGNEEDRWWTGSSNRNQSIEPLMLAAKYSAVYDGHEGTMAGCGIKAADPTMKVVMSATADMNIDYIKMIYLWKEEKRTDKKFPADVINFHFYCVNGWDTNTPNKAICPEQMGLKARVTTYGQWCLRYIPECEIWFSEFGIDTSTGSNFGVPGTAGISSIPGMDTWQVQAAWTLRSFLEVESTGYISRMVYYELQNENLAGVSNNEVPNFTNANFLSSIQFQTSGMVLSELAFITATSSSINVATVANGTTVTFTRTTALWDTQYFKPGSIYTAHDPANSGNSVSFSCVSYVGSSIVGTVTGRAGSGSFTTFTINTPYAKKLNWYVMDNTIAVRGGLKFVADMSTVDYRVYKFSNGTNRDAFIAWSPTQNNTTWSAKTINIGRTSCIFRDVESQTGAEVPQAVTGTSITVDITEMPKIFYSNY